jgi:hypothetical protein
VSEAKGPYSTGDSVGLVFKDGREVENFDSERDKLNACRLANAAWSQGRASRDGLRSQLRSNNTVLFDVASLVGAGKYFDAIELCHAKVFGNNQALEDDGEGR